MFNKVWQEIQSARVAPNAISKLREYSYLAWGVERLFFFLRFCSPSILFIDTRTLIHARLDKADQTQASESVSLVAKRRARQVDLYILFWVIFEWVLIVWSGWQVNDLPRWIIRILIGIRLIDIIQANVNLNVFDRLRFGESHITASLTRNLILAIITYLELILAFGILYISVSHSLITAVGHPRPRDWEDPIYFSFITQLTIGYGDIYPIGFARVLASCQGFLGLIFSLLIMGRFISYMPMIRTAFGDHEAEA